MNLKSYKTNSNKYKMLFTFKTSFYNTFKVHHNYKNAYQTSKNYKKKIKHTEYSQSMQNILMA